MGVTRALPFPVPARAPLLARSGILALCFPALLSTVGLKLPLFPWFPFLACDLASLGCTVQIKLSLLVSLILENAIQVEGIHAKIH